VPLVAAFTVIGLVAAPASANRRQDAMSWALRQIGCPYTYGGTGPCHHGFDCSGLVVAAYAHVGMGLPRTTYGMLASRALKPQLDHPKPGNLVFFGDGHVTLYYWRHVVLQAPQPGENVQLTRWYPGSDWVPTGYYKIRDAGNGPMRGLAKWVHQMISRYHLKIHNHTTLRDRFPRR
jgi:cell wall-associated NlpC family hydrolase